MKTSEICQRLLKIDSCAISDALDSFGLEGVVLGLSAVAAPRRIAGRVVTVKLVAVEVGQAVARHLGTAAIEGRGKAT